MTEELNKYKKNIENFVKEVVYLCLIYSGTVENRNSKFVYTETSYKIKNVYKKPEYGSRYNKLTIKNGCKKLFVCRWDYVVGYSSGERVEIKSIDKLEVGDLENLKDLTDKIKVKINLLGG